MKQITLLVATSSLDKIEGIKNAFINFFPEEEYEVKVYSSKTDSGVPEQPFGNDTYQGAYNRVNNVKKKYESSLTFQGIKIDYIVSCEAGIDNSNQLVVNGQIKTLYASEQVICIFDSNTNSYSFGKSSSWTIPEKDIEEIKTIGLDQYLRQRECTGLHDVGMGKYITRRDAITEGTNAAIASSLFIEKCNDLKKNPIVKKDSEVER